MAEVHFSLLAIPTINELGWFPILWAKETEPLNHIRFHHWFYDAKAGISLGEGLAPIISKFGHRDCFDLRDKIYGFLALVHTAFTQRIQVDYEKSLLEVLLDYIAAYDAFDITNSSIGEIVQGRLKDMLSSLETIMPMFLDDEQFANDLKVFLGSRSGLTHRPYGWFRYGPGVLVTQGIAQSGSKRHGKQLCAQYAQVINWQPLRGKQSLAAWVDGQGASDTPSTVRLLIDESLFEAPKYTSPGDIVVRIAYEGAELFLVCRRQPLSTFEFDLIGLARRIAPSDDPPGQHFRSVRVDDYRVSVRLPPTFLLALVLQQIGSSVVMDSSWLELNGVVYPDVLARHR